MSSIERHGTGRPHWIRSFYIRRVLRIYPLAIATILLVVSLHIPWRVPVAGVSGEVALLNIRTLASNLTLTQNLTKSPNILGVLWSLPLEVQMYAVLPFCYLLTRRGAGEVGAMVVGFLALGLLVRFGLLPHSNRLGILVFGPCFAGGLVGYHIAQRRVRAQLPSSIWPFVIFAAGAMFVLMRPGPEHPERSWLPCLFLGAGIPLTRDASLSFVTAAMGKVCDVSYGLYLLHVPVLWFSFVVLHRSSLWLQWAACTGLLVALPTLAHRYIEQPGIRLGRALAKEHPPV